MAVDRGVKEARMNMKRKEKLKWWRRFWPQIIIVSSSLVVLQCILYLSGYIDLLKLFGGILVVFVSIPLAYGIRYIQIRYQTTKLMQLINRIAFIGGFGAMAWFITFFGTAFIVWAVKGMPKLSDPPPEYLVQLLRFILLFIVPWIVGGYIGDRIGKRRNYRAYV